MKVKEILFCRASDIVVVVVHGNEVLNITMCDTGKWKEISGGRIFEVDFSQSVDFVNGRYVFVQKTVLASEKNAENMESYKLLSQLCELVFVNFLEAGGALIHGIELDVIAQGGFTNNKISNTKFRFDEVFFWLDGNLLSKSTTLAPKMGLTKEQLLLL